MTVGHPDNQQQEGDGLCLGNFGLTHLLPCWFSNIALPMAARRQGGEQGPGGIFLSIYLFLPNPQGQGGGGCCEMNGMESLWQDYDAA